MSKKVKQALGVAAAIAVPFAAPAIANSIGLSSAIGSVFGSALTGATLGAGVTSALGGSGRSIRQAALLGGLGGGVSGYAAQPAATTVATSAEPAVAATTQPSLFGATPTSAAPIVRSETASAMEAAGLPTYTPERFGFMPATPAISTTPPVEPSFLARTGEYLSGIARKPEIAVPAAIQLGTGIYGSMQAEKAQRQAERLAEQQLAAEQERYRQEQAAYTQRQGIAQKTLQEAEQFNPEYFGMQRARAAQRAGLAATSEALRRVPSYNVGLQESTRRRGELEAARSAGTAYDVGFGTGVTARQQARQAAIGLMGPAPSLGVSTAPSYYAGQAEQARQSAAGISDFFGSLMERERQQRERDEDRQFLAGLVTQRGGA